MSQGGNTLSLYPSSDSHFATSPATTNMNTGVGVGGGMGGAMPIVSADQHNSSDEEKGAAKAGRKGGGGGGGGSGPGGKSRRELPAGAVATLKAWLLSPEHFTHPYPTPQDQIMLMHKTGIDKKQLKNWFTNARRRIWKPMLKKQLEAGKLAATAAGGAGVVATSHPQAMLTAVGAAPIAAGGGQHPPRHGGVGVAVPAGISVGVPQPELPSQQQQQQQQPPQQEMYTNFQQAQQQQADPNLHQHQPAQQQQYQQYQQQPQQQYQQHGQIQQQVQYDQSTGQVQQQTVQYDQYGNLVYDPNYQQPVQYQQQQDGAAPQQQHQQQQQPGNPNPNQFPVSHSIGSLAPMNPASSLASMNSFGSKMNKTDSHAVLMELFARDQDLVRQAAGVKGPAGGAQQQQQAQAPANGATRSLQSSGLSGNLRWANGTAAGAGGGGGGQPSPSMGQKQHSVTFEGVPSLSSWPHFSSVSSLNNLGGLQGVKSITNLSAADLSSQGNLNKMGNLAQVKSSENMGRGDSFAFLEVFFDDKSGAQRGVKRERDYDDAIGLSLDGDDNASPGQQQFNKRAATDQVPSSAVAESGAPTPAPLPEDGKDNVDGGGNESSSDGGKLKRAYDDALAARGLIAVRRSCEKLTDLALPAKMQRTLSQEYIRQHNQGQPMGDFFSTNNSAYAPNNQNRNNGLSSQLMYHQQQPTMATPSAATSISVTTPVSENNIVNAASVEVPSSTKCSICSEVNVDTQLRPCGHMFHGRCLKPSLQNATGPPKCPICSTPMQSAILAVPSGAAAGAEGGVGAGTVAGVSAGAVAGVGAGTVAGVAGGKEASGNRPTG